MKVSRMIELLSKCNPDTDVSFYYSQGNFSDSIEFIEDHVQQTAYEQSVFLYSFRPDKEYLQSIWRAEKINVIASEPDYIKTKGD